jgi:hypothetical protein
MANESKSPTLLHWAVIALPVLALIMHPECSSCRKDPTAEPRVTVYHPGSEYPSEYPSYADADRPGSQMRQE